MLFCMQQLGKITYVDHIVASLHRSNLTSRRTKARSAIDRSPVAWHGKLTTYGAGFSSAFISSAILVRSLLLGVLGVLCVCVFTDTSGN